jgi:hypothetical protein
VPMTAFASVFAGFKTAADLTKTIISLHDAAIIREKVAELQGVILSAQSSAISAQTDQFSLLEQVRILEGEIADLKAWDAEKERYQLTKLAGGGLAYMLKEQAQSSGPEHYLCAACYEDRRKSILQPETRFPGRAFVLACHKCGSEAYVTGAWYPEHAKAARRPRGG